MYTGCLDSYPFSHIVPTGLVIALKTVTVDACNGEGQHELQQTQRGVEDDFGLQKSVSEDVHFKTTVFMNIL